MQTTNRTKKHLIIILLSLNEYTKKVCILKTKQLPQNDTLFVLVSKRIRDLSQMIIVHTYMVFKMPIIEYSGILSYRYKNKTTHSQDGGKTLI